ncbi:conserved hypothetical protein [Cotesia vestalis bracovirus]|nr:conserved hypothetical protein [Cotesia vestalis bracovirus]
MSDSPLRGTLESKQSNRQHLGNPSATLYNQTTMHHGKTSIFLFFLIIGTSVFPNGSSTGLASAKPSNPLLFIEGASLGMNILQNFMPGKDQSSDEQFPSIIYGAVTNNKDNNIRNENIGGSISFGSNVQQEGNYYGSQPSYGQSSSGPYIMSDLPLRGTLESKQSNRQHLANPSATLYNQTTMHHVKTSIFLLFLIIGTSVFPNGGSTGLVNAKPFAPLVVMAGASLGMEIMNSVMSMNKKPAGQHRRKIVYGSETNNEENTYDNRNVKVLPSGSSSTRAYWKNSPDLINDGLKALANHYEDQAPRSPGHINYASITNQLGNDFDDSHIGGDVSLGSNTVQRHNDYTGSRNRPGVVITYGSETNQGFNSYNFANVGGDHALLRLSFVEHSSDPGCKIPDITFEYDNGHVRVVVFFTVDSRPSVSLKK